MIKLFVFLLTCYSTPVKDWRALWGAIWEQSKTQKALKLISNDTQPKTNRQCRNFHLSVLKEATDRERKFYYALVLADGHLRNFSPNDPAFDAVISADELAQLELMLPAYRDAVENDNPGAVVQLIKSPLAYELGENRQIAALN